MAFFQQHRDLYKRVKKQLEAFDDHEKGLSASPSARLSGLTATDRDVRGACDSDQEQKPAADFPYAALDGITVETSESGEKYYCVDYETPDDHANPRNWSTPSRLRVTVNLILIAFVVTAASAVDSAVAPQIATDFGVSEVVAALSSTAMFLIGFGLGALLASPASEMVGRYPVYVAALSIFGCWLIGAALAPNVGAQIVFRFLAGLFASAPLTVAGGTISDIWTAKEKTWAFPLFAIVGFGGPVLGPVMASYIGVTGVLSWRWSEWIMLIAAGLVLLVVLAFKRETLSPQILAYKARYFRKLTGDERFKTKSEAQGHSTWTVIKKNFTRPFILALEPIVVLYTLYLTVIYIVLFTFLEGYPVIFQETYGINQGLSNLCFLGLLIGILSSMLLVPMVVRITNRQLARDGDDGSGSALKQENRTLFAMVGAPLIPIGLFWMAWTDYSAISIWSPLASSVAIGFGIVTIFMSAYMYIIDSYQVYAASALTFVALVRYLAAGGMTVVAVPMYANLGRHWTLTLLGCISTVIVPIPYALYIWGEKIRKRSKYAVAS